LNHVRQRTTVAMPEVYVLECRAHGNRFSVYQPGWEPYQHRPTVVVAHDGQPVVRLPEVSRLQGTLFEAAEAGARGYAWNRGQGEAHGGPFWGSQVRELEHAQQCAGVAPGMSDQQRELVSAALGVDLLALREGAAKIVAAPGYRCRGKAVVAVLARVPEEVYVERLSLARCVAGLCGRPLTWDPTTRSLRRPAFPTVGTRAPP
jgi:hypothetical protein